MSAAVNITSLERQLARFAGREGAVLVGHANTAFYLTLQYIRQLRGPGDVLVSPRPEAPPFHADRDQAHPDRGRPDLRARHARPGRGHDDGRHHRGDERRA